MSGARRVADWFRRIPAPRWDALLAVLVVAGAGLGLVLGPGHAPDPGFRQTDAFTWVVALSGCATLAWRRRWPTPVVAVACGATSLLVLLDYDTTAAPVAIIFALYTAGSWAPPRRSVWALGLAMATVVLAVVSHTPEFDTANITGTVAQFVAAYVVGRAMRTRRLHVLAQLAEARRDAELAAERALRAATGERLRIAQELHDVVAHSLSVMVVQAGVAAHVIDQQPDEARRALEHIAEVGRSSLTELRRLLGVLRDEDGAISTAPAQGLEDLPRLVETVEAAGLPVSLRVEGPPCPVPGGVGLSAYRIAQEALTNVIKHAGPARAEVLLRYRPGEVELVVSDDGRGVAADPAGPRVGHGLLGMRERVAVYGGELVSGAQAGGGFRVRARIPYGDAP
ncbi:MAG: sensor histidine kinase [Acidimicrobiales bacterium]